MTEENQIEEMAKLCPFYKDGKCEGDGDRLTDCDLMCKMFGFITNLQIAGYRKQTEGEWVFETNHYFNDYGDLKVYATAKCSECEKPYPFNPTVASEFVERPETLSGYEDWDIDIEPIKAEVLERAKSNKSLYPFCPNCGAMMKGGE
jgi:hypothetical protein